MPKLPPTPVETGEIYDQITQLWASDKFDRSNGIAVHEYAIAFTQRRRRALDVGCGCSGRFIELLQGHGFAPIGIDISRQMIALARQRHPEVQLHHADICNWELPTTYDFITAWDSIWHVPLSAQKAVFTKLVKGLAEDGVLIFSCGGTDEVGELYDSTMGPEVYYGSLGVNVILALLDELGCRIRHVEFDQYPELHVCIIAQKSSNLASRALD